MCDQLQHLTKRFFIYDIHNREGWAWMIVQTDAEVPEHRLEAFRDVILKLTTSWVPACFRIYRYSDEGAFQKELDHWDKTPHLGPTGMRQRLELPFLTEDQEFEGIGWRVLMQYDSI